DVIRRAAAPQRTLQQQIQLLPDPVLGDELAEPLGPDTGLRIQLGIVGESRHQTGHRDPPSARAAAAPPRCRIAARSSTCIDGTPWPSATSRSTSSPSSVIATSAWDAVQPKPTNAWRIWSGQVARSGTRVAPALDTGIGPTLSCSSRQIRSAPFLPMPGTAVSTAISELAIALRTASGVWTASTASASRGPTPLAVRSSSKSCFASESAKP